eukprot:scaffold7358_cov252-Pinguiococcus_pyrenoidosus.AAC.11
MENSNGILVLKCDNEKRLNRCSELLSNRALISSHCQQKEDRVLLRAEANGPGSEGVLGRAKFPPPFSSSFCSWSATAGGRLLLLLPRKRGEASAQARKPFGPVPRGASAESPRGCLPRRAERQRRHHGAKWSNLSRELRYARYASVSPFCASGNEAALTTAEVAVYAHSEKLFAPPRMRTADA